MAAFSNHLRKNADLIWQKILNHLFIMEMSNGSLPIEKFKFFVKQDYYYLIEYSKCIAIAVAKARDFKMMQFLSNFLHSTLTLEMKSLEQLANTLEISKEELLHTEPMPVNYFYTNHLLSIAYSEVIGCLIAALLVCEWSYLEISKKLFQSDKIKSHPILSRWIRTYLSQDYKVLVNALRGFLDDIAKSSSAQEKEKMKNLFILGSKYEYMFWEGVYNQERWQI